MNPDELAATAQSPVLVYVALVIAVLAMVANAFPKILGPIGKSLMEWSRQRRESRIAEEDFRIKDLRDENAYLVTRVSAGVAREHRWSMEANRARVWMRKALRLLTDHDVPIESYPELMTPDPPPSDPTHKETSSHG